MAPLIRAAQVADEPRILPLRVEPIAQQPKENKLSMLEAAPSLDSTATINKLSSMRQANADLLEEAGGDSEKIALVPQTLAPEVEQALLEERRLAHDEAVKEGYADGHEKGLVEAQLSLQTQLAEVGGLLHSVRKAFETQVNGLEDVIVAAAYEAICKIIGASLHNREGVIAIVREVMSHVKQSEPITIRVAPSDYYLLTQDENTLKTGYEGMQVTLLPDDRVLLGGCLIETSGGNLDGRLETQLQQLTDSILNAKRQQLDWKEQLHVV